MEYCDDDDSKTTDPSLKAARIPAGPLQAVMHMACGSSFLDDACKRTTSAGRPMEEFEDAASLSSTNS
jgi:hypothetical protein